MWRGVLIIIMNKINNLEEIDWFLQKEESDAECQGVNLGYEYYNLLLLKSIYDKLCDVEFESIGIGDTIYTSLKGKG